MMNGVFWDVMLHGSCKNEIWEECITPIIRVERLESTLFLSVLQLVVIVNVVFSLLIHFTLLMEAILSSERSVLTRGTRSQFPED
jgi:hypothetical protein